MTCISDIDETGINRNLNVRYQRDEIYVSRFDQSFNINVSHNLIKWGFFNHFFLNL